MKTISTKTSFWHIGAFGCSIVYMRHRWPLCITVNTLHVTILRVGFGIMWQTPLRRRTPEEIAELAARIRNPLDMNECWDAKGGE